MCVLKLTWSLIVPWFWDWVLNSGTFPYESLSLSPITTLDLAFVPLKFLELI